ncbi:hypothetical protein ID866_7583 [Astraeus odoratus]|nr:hypothetical protein ID866_7583 [Astraeus odoratus]
MTELAHARAELAQLDKREHELLEELWHIHRNRKVWRTKIDEHTTKGRSLIDALPVELLSRILHLALRAEADNGCDVHRHRKWKLAAVSRRWRRTILDSPAFWTTITLSDQWTPPLVEVHLERSRDCLVDISIHGSNYDVNWPSPLIDAAMPCAERWRSFAIHGDYNVSYVHAFTESAITSFPSLIRLDLGYGAVQYPWFLERGCMPALEHLGINCLADSSVICIPSGIKSLDLTITPYRRLESGISLHLPSETLTKLHLTTELTSASFHLNPLHLPYLKSLGLNVRDLLRFLEVIVAPALTQLSCEKSLAQSRISASFSHIAHKFPDVHHLVLSGWRISRATLAMLCSACPSVRHIRSDEHCMSILFDMDDMGSYPVDGWQDLECYTVDEVLSMALLFEHPILAWHRQRKLRGPMFRLHIQKIHISQRPIPPLFDTIREWCTVEEFELGGLAPLQLDSVVRV